MPQIKVCHITDVHRPEDVRIFHKECVSLVNNGYQVYLVEQGDSYIKNGVNIVGIGEQPISRMDRIRHFAPKAYAAATSLNCDIYHIHDPELLPYALKLKRKGKKVIYDIHESVIEDILTKEWLPVFARRIIAKGYKSYEKYVCKRIDALISVTPFLIRRYRKINRNTFQITNYPIIQPLIKSERQEGRIVFAGGIDKLWSHKHIIEAISKVDKCEYVLMGKAYSQDYLESLKSLEGWRKVNYLGLVKHEQVFPKLCESGIGVALAQPGADTNDKEGTLGNTKIFEEMMAGLPVICTDFDLWKEIIYKYQCGICIDPQDVELIKEAIEYLVENPEKASEMGKNARIAVEEEYNWSTQEEILLNIYSKIVSDIAGE